ncbi:MAG: dihydroorotase [Oligoflexia bacterium]|nr:dihydroorotase [Oligoflexia bacterium]
MRILVANGTVVCPVQNINEKKDVIIENDIISSIEKPGSVPSAGFDRVIDASSMVVAPGLVDMHTHLREPGHEGAETIATGTRSAASGGFTSIAAMPNTNPVNDNPYVTSFIKTKAKEEGVIKVYPIGAITVNIDGKELAEIGEMHNAGIIAVSDDGNCVMDSYVMRKAMDYCKQFGLPVIDHCEDMNLKGQGVMNDGYYSMKLGLRGIPAVSEDIMVARDVALCHHTGCRTHIAHVSSKGSVRFIRDAKQDGIPVTAEVTPHHLFLTEEAVAGYNPSTKVNPPLRTDEDIEALIQGLKKGIIDVIATDHAPHSIEKKDIEFQLAKSGMIGFETALPLCLELVRKKHVKMPELIKLMSANPAKILGIQGGSLEKGTCADIVIFDQDREWTYTEDAIVSKSKNSPFIGKTLKGKVLYTVCSGRIVYEA